MVDTPITYPPTRAAARQSGSTYYLTGKACPHGHRAPRYTSNGACTECLNVRTQAGLRGEIPPRECRKCGEFFTGLVCPSCRKKIARIWRGKNRKHLTDEHLKKVDICRVFVREYRAENPCADCGLKFPWYVMEFDHTEGRKKEGDMTVARVISTGSIERVKIEIAKCELVCANCHKTRTHNRAVEAGTRLETGTRI